MWLEVKAIFTVIGLVFMGIVLAVELATGATLFAFFLIMSMGIIVLGDIILMAKITNYHLIPLLDPTPQGKELCILHTIGGGVDFVNTTKGPFGKREFLYHNKEDGRKHEASIINRGHYPIRTLNGNHGFVGHESYDLDVDLYETAMLQDIEGDDIKDIYDKQIKDIDEQVDEKLKELEDGKQRESISRPERENI